MTVREFLSTDAGAPSMAGQSGALLAVLDACLTIGRVFTTADDAAFTDRSAEARLDGGAAFALFPTPATGDRVYFGCQLPFSEVDVDLATLGVGGAYAFEYRRNDATWQTLTVTDGTSGFTQDGKITFTPPGNWATVSVNGVTMYYIRVRPTSAPSTNPTCNSAVAFGWLRAFEGTNKAAYRAKTGTGRCFFRIQDDSPHVTALGREARCRGYEAMTDVDTGTGDFPTVAQFASGIICRKSTTNDATARTWRAYADHRTITLQVLTTDTASVYYALHFGEIFSFVSGDLYNGIIRGRTTENSGTAGFETLDMTTTVLGSAITGAYMPRSYTGIGTSINVGIHTDGVKNGGGSNLHGIGNFVPYPNGPDSGLYAAPLWIHESTRHVRGILRGIWANMHVIASFQDLDTASGAGDQAGKTFRILKLSGSSSIYTMETSDTWRTN